jgi:hypothetical protein
MFRFAWHGGRFAHRLFLADSLRFSQAFRDTLSHLRHDESVYRSAAPGHANGVFVPPSFLDGADFIPFFLAGWASFPEESRKYCGVFFTFIPFIYPLDTHFDIMNVQNHFESL